MNQHRYAVANEIGEILQIYTVSQRMIPCGEDVNDDTHYVTESSEILAKAAYDPQVSVEGLLVTISQLPDGVAVETNGHQAVTQGESLEIHYDVPGAYTIDLRGKVEYLDAVLEVTVDDA